MSSNLHRNDLRRLSTRCIGLALLLLACGVRALPTYAVPAFPSAEGFGVNAAGGRGGTIYHVNNLNDSGAGSFRDAVSSGKRIIVFDVGGIVSLKSILSVSKDLTIAGQTAPGDGITIYGGSNVPGDYLYGGGRVSYTDANRTITRGMRFRHGAYAAAQQSDGVGIARGNNMIFDRCAVTWGTDETFSINGAVANVTIQNCIIGQGLEPHSAGGLVESVSEGGGGISLLRNLYIDNNTRNPKVNGTNQFVNNVIYNWGATGGDAYIMGATTANSYANVFNNYFINGLHTASSKKAFTRGTPTFHIYAEGNYQDNNKNGKLDGRLLTKADYANVDWLLAPHDFPTVTTLSAQDAYAHIVEKAGPMIRDNADKYMIEELTSLGTKGFNERHEFDGVMKDKFLIAKSSRPAGFDSDKDGMPDEWEHVHALNKTFADNNGDYDKTGYTNVEKYINSLLDGAYPDATLPSPWTKNDIGNVGVTGTSGESNGIFRLHGAGANIAGTTDAFHFAHQPFNSDGSITARVTAVQNTSNDAKAGVMIRNSAATNAAFANVVATPNGRVLFSYRNNDGDTVNSDVANVRAPVWVKLTRSNSSFAGFYSTDGKAWTQIASSQNLNLSSNALAGLVSCAASNTVLSTATFDKVSVVTDNAPPKIQGAYWKGDADNLWSTNTNGNTNWATDTNGATDTGLLPDASTDVVFAADNATNLPATTLGADFTVKSLNINSTTNVTISGTHNLTLGAGGLTVANGAGATTLNASGQVNLGANQLWTNNSTNALTIDSIVSGNGFGLTKAGTGTLIFNAANTYTGNTTINDGTLVLGASERIDNTSDLTLAGGTLSTGGFNEALGSLSVSDNSIIDFGSGTSTLTFSGISTLASGKTLSLTNYTTGSDHLFIGGSAILTPTQLAQIFFSETPAQQLSSGEVIPFVAVNTPPTISSLEPLTLTINTSSDALAFTVNDQETPATALTVSATSSNTTLVPNTNINLTLGGSSANRTITVTPSSNATGQSTITLTVSDGTLSTSTTFLLTVPKPIVNKAPTLNAITNPAPINEDAATQNISLSGIGAGSGETQNLTVTATSSNTALIPDPSVSYTSPDTTGSLSYQPLADQFGSAIITVKVQDDGGTDYGGIDTIIRNFTVTVNRVNDAPTFVAGGDITVDEDSGAYAKEWATAISAGPANESSQNIAFTVTNNKSGLFSVQPKISTVGVLSFTPTLNASGNAIVTVQLRDTGGTANGGQDSTTPQTFTFSVNAVNDAPTISGLVNTTTKEDTSKSIFFAISDQETAVNALQLKVSSSDTTLVPDNSLLLSGSGGQRGLTITPAPNQYGQTTITLTVTDSEGGSSSSSLVLTVSPVNDIPVTQGASFTGNIGQDIPFSLVASDVDNDALTYQIVSFDGDGSIGGGQLSGDAPNLKFISYTPDTYTLTFRVRDVAGAISNISTVTFVIGSVSGCTASGEVNSSEPNASYTVSALVPLPNVQLRLEQEGRIVATTATNSKGHYTFYGINPGNYLVYVNSISTNGNSFATSLPFVFSRKLKVKLAKTTPVDAQFSVPVFTFYSIWGRALVKNSDKEISPLAGANVRLSKRSNTNYPAFATETIADKNGFFLFKYLGKASFNLMASAPNVTFTRFGVKINLPATRRPIAPAARLDLNGTKNTGSTKSSINAY